MHRARLGPTRLPSGPRCGVSLLAIVVSLCAIACLAVLAIPSFFASPDVTLDNACELLLRDIRTAQNRATYLGSGAVFHVHADGWEATRPDGTALVRQGEDHGIVRAFSENGVFEGVRVERIELGGDGKLAFDARGLALEGGSVELVFGGSRRRVSIEAGSGLAVAADESGAIIAGDALRQDVEPR